MMGKRKLVSGKPKIKRLTGMQKSAERTRVRQRRTKVKAANKMYYRKNRANILKRDVARRTRRARGDVRTSRRASVL